MSSGSDFIGDFTSPPFSELTVSMEAATAAADGVEDEVEEE